jgi:tetraacyldisaccharide 4'-kinase
VLLAEQLPGVSVVVSVDRARGGRHALESLPTKPSLFLLDDGFSHVRLQRDLDILVFPGIDPIAGGRLAPAGRLREPLSAAALADAAVLTGASPGDEEPLESALQRHGFQGDVFVSATVALPARLESGEELESPASVLAVSGIARPQSFERLATSQGFEVVATLALSDHHDYPEATLVELRRLWSEHSAAAILTTSKDMVKLRGRLDLPVAELPIEARPEEAFFPWLDSRVETLGSRS